MNELGAYIGGLVRSFMLTAGAWAVTTGYFTTETWAQVAGAASIIVGVLWSMASKKWAAERVTTAAVTGVDSGKK